jgi:hypothetical protein
VPSPGCLSSRLSKTDETAGLVIVNGKPKPCSRVGGTMLCRANAAILRFGQTTGSTAGRNWTRISQQKPRSRGATVDVCRGSKPETGSQPPPFAALNLEHFLRIRHEFQAPGSGHVNGKTDDVGGAVHWGSKGEPTRVR